MRTTTRRPDLRPSIVIREHGSRRGTCYVSTFQGPRSVWASWGRGNYPAPSRPQALELARAIEARGIRWGAYGDPAAIPTAVVRRWSSAGRWTGYTHQWRRRPSLRGYLMASVDSPAEALEAQARGWRTFRVEHDRSEDLVLEDLELLCPASDEAGKRTACDRCGLCNGTGGSIGHRPQAFRGSVQGLELWRGPSRLTGDPVVCLVTGLQAPSSNAKTGPMLQTWILAQDEAPHVAQASGADEAVCGDCPMRPILAKLAKKGGC